MLKPNQIAISDLHQADGGLDMVRLSLDGGAQPWTQHLDGGTRTALDLAQGQVMLLANEGVDTRLFQLIERVFRQGSALLETRREAAIDKLVEASLELVPPKPAEIRLQDAVARFRLKFLQTEPCYSSTDIHVLRGSKGQNRAQIAARMKASGKAFAVRYGDKDVFPAFQFDAEGRPYSVVAQVLAALPEHMTPWDIAGWFVRRNLHLEGAVPRDLIAAEDAHARLIAAAQSQGDGPVG